MARTILALAIQSVKGTPAASSTHRVQVIGGTSIGPLKRASFADSVSTQRLPLTAHVTELRVDGSAEMIMHPDVMGLLFYGVLGAKAVSGASDPWTHTFTPATTQPWLTLWRNVQGILNERFTDCKIKSLRITSSAGQAVKVVIEVIGITAAWKTSEETTATLEIGDPFFHWHGKAALLVEGSAVSSIDEWELMIDSGTQARDTLTAYDVRTGPTMRATMTVNQTVVNDDLWGRYAYASASPANNASAALAPLEIATSAMSFKLTEQASPERSVQIVIPRVVLSAVPQPVPSGWDPLRHTLTFDALRPSSGAGITATVRNARSAY